MEMNVFLFLTIAFFICLGLSYFCKRFAKWSANVFKNSDSFQSVRLWITIFGIFALVFGFIKYYLQVKPVTISQESSFKIRGTLINSYQSTEPRTLYAAEQEVLYNIFSMPFSEGWQPTFTPYQMNSNEIVSNFSHERGKFITNKDVQDKMKPNNVTCLGFYLPPDAEFEVKRLKGENNEPFTKIQINNKSITLILRISISGEVCYLDINYTKKNWLDNILNKYSNYDKWFNTIFTFAERIQLINRQQYQITEQARKMFEK